MLLLFGLIANGQTTITINGSDTLCLNSNGLYSVSSPTTGVTYSWSVTPLGSISGSGVGATVNYLSGNTAGTTTITVNGRDLSNTLVETGTLNIELISISTPKITTNQRVGCIGVYDAIDTNSSGEPISIDSLFLDDEYSCPKVCENSLVEYTVVSSGGQIQWTASGGTIQGSSTGTTVYVLWGAVGTGSITVNEYSGKCSTQKSICIDIIEKPVAAFSVIPDPDPVVDCDTFDVCFDSKVAFNNLSTGSANSQIVSWYWDFGDGTSSSQKVPPPHVFGTPGLYKTQLIVTNECGCTDTFCAHINVNMDPAPDLLCQAVACEGDTVEYCTSSKGCSSYNWQVVNGTIVNNNNDCITVQWDQINGTDGFGFVSLDINCPGVCAAPTSIKVPVVQSDPIVTGPTTLCVGTQYKFSIPLWPGTEYNWGVLTYPGAVVDGQRKGNEVVLDFATPGTYDVHVTWKNHISICGGDKTFSVTVLDLDTIVGPTTECKSLSSYVTYDLSSGNSTNWRMTDPDGYIYTSTGINYGAAFYKAGIYKLEALDFCADPLEIIVTEITDTIETITGKDIACLNTPYTYTASTLATSGVIINWSITGAGTFLGGSSGSSVTVVWNSASGPHEVNAFVQSTAAPYCTGPVKSYPVLIDVPNPTVTGPDTVCSDSYNNYSCNYNSPNATYTWQITPQTGGNVQSGTYDPDIVFKANRETAAAAVQITATVKVCGSTVSDTKNITVLPALVPNVYTSGDTFCNGDLITFTTDPGAQYIWSFGDQTVRNTDTAYTTYEYWFDVGDTLFWPDPTAIKEVFVRVTAYGSDPDFPMLCPPGGESFKAIYIRPGPTVVDKALDTLVYPCGGTVSTRITAWDTLCTGTPSYQWYHQSTPVSTPTPVGTNSSLYTATSAGYYYCIITDGATGCRGKGNTIHVVVLGCPNPGCVGTVSVTATLDRCGAVDVVGTPTPGGAYSNPQISSTTAINSPIFSTTGTLIFSQAGNHTVKYHMAVEQSPGVFCEKAAYTSVTVPLVQNYKVDIQCGTGQYDITLMDMSTYIAGTRETRWELCDNPSFSGASYIDRPFAQNDYLLPPAVTSGVWYVRHRTRTVGPNYPAGLPRYCEEIFSITIPAWPTVSFNYDPSSICEGLPVQFDAVITPAPPATTVASYLWTFDDLAFSAVDPTYRVYSYDAGLGASPNIRQPFLTITDEYGCTHSSATQNVSIHENNLNGFISGGSTVCSGPLTLTYNNTGGSTPTSYLWSHEAPTPGTSTSSINSSGSYFVTVEDANSCRFVTLPDDATIINLQHTNITGRTQYCQGEEVFLSAFSGSNITYAWERNMASVGTNSPELRDAGLSAGGSPYSYTVEVASTSGGITCSTTVGPVSVTISAPPSGPPSISAINVLDCAKYELELVGSGPGGPGTYQWLNGPAGTNYTIYSGGPYRLIFTNPSGCSSFVDTMVADAPEKSFGWFPDGCYTICPDQYPFWLYGPLGIWDRWEWAAASGTIISGMNSSVPPYSVTGPDDYTLTLENVFCAQTTDVMSVTNGDCSDCVPILVDWDFYCDPTNPGGYTFDLTLDNPTPDDIDVNVALGSGPAIPFKLNLPSGSHMFNLYAVTMQGPPDTIEVSYIMKGGQKCFQRVFVDPSKYTYPCTGWPSQKPGKGQNDEVAGALTDNKKRNTGMVLYPNPANESLTVNYRYRTDNVQNKRLIVNDLLGRKVAEVPLSNLTGSHKLNVAQWTQGVYIVRMEENGATIHTARITITH